MVLTEPITTLTDYAIAVVALILAFSLGRIGWQKKQYSIGLWAIAFASVALAALLGGTCHGFLSVLPKSWLVAFWQGMVCLLSLASFALLIGSIIGTAPAKQQRWLLLAVGVKTSLIWLILLQTPLFEFAALDYSTSLTFVLILQLQALLTGTTPAVPWLIAGTLVSGLALCVLVSRLNLPPLFAANDLYHLVQLVGLGLLYQGAKHLRDRPIR